LAFHAKIRFIPEVIIQQMSLNDHQFCYFAENIICIEKAENFGIKPQNGG
jgi:hypothetical protein